MNGELLSSSTTSPASRYNSAAKFEREWGPHEPDYHPAALKLHVERRAQNAKDLSFQELCGESAFIAETDLDVVRRIGSGSFARVEIAKYRKGGDKGGESPQTVAVKRLKAKAAVEITQFASEANILRKLHHPNIVAFIGVGSSEGNQAVAKQAKSSCYMIQEYMNGGNLKQKIFKQGNVLYPIYSDHDAVQWGKQIAEGLAYLHSANPLVLHRDLKLENILLNEEPQVGTQRPRVTAKICDFGLAVSLLDPHFVYRQADSLDNFRSIPSGLASPRIDTDFHRQMFLSVQGSAILDAKLAEQAEKLKQAMVLDPSSPKPLERITVSFSGSTFKPRLSGPVDQMPSVDESQPPDCMIRSNSVSIAEVAHGRVQPPPHREVKLPKPPRVGRTKTMSAAGQGIMKSPGSPSDAETPIHEAYLLTGRAGSFLYMAPEVVMSRPYNEKADVFSLGVILFELFFRKTLAALIMELDDTSGSVEMFAYQVAGGYRYPIPEAWPSELKELISQCWAQDPDKRPSTANVAKRMAKLEDSELFRKWEEEHSGGILKQGCCTIQ